MVKHSDHFLQVDAGQPGGREHGRKERILRAAITARDRLCAVKSHCEALLSSQKSPSKGDISMKWTLSVTVS